MFTTRNFTWADLPAILDMIEATKSLDGSGPQKNPVYLEEELGRPGLNPEENCYVIGDGQKLIAYGLVEPEIRIGRAVFKLAVHPDHRWQGIEEEIVNLAVGRARSLGAGVLHISRPPSESWRRLLEHRGFSQIRTYWIMMWQGADLPEVEMAEGLTIETFKPGEEARLTKIHNDSFEGSWGFSPNTLEEVAYRVGMSISPSGGILFLRDGEQTVGYCWTCLIGDTGDATGIISMIGVTPSHRGRGMSKPILVAAIDFLNRAGAKYVGLEADGANVPAIKLYRSLGFVKTTELHWFELALSGA